MKEINSQALEEIYEPRPDVDLKPSNQDPNSKAEQSRFDSPKKRPKWPIVVFLIIIFLFLVIVALVTGFAVFL